MKIISNHLKNFIHTNIHIFIGCLLFIICIVLLSYLFSKPVIEGLEQNVYIRFYKINEFNPVCIIPNNSVQKILNLFSTNIGNKEIYKLNLNTNGESYNLPINTNNNTNFFPITMNTNILQCYRDLYNYVKNNNISNIITDNISNITINYDSKNTPINQSVGKVTFTYTFNDNSSQSNAGLTIYMDTKIIDERILSAIGSVHTYTINTINGIEMTYIYPEPVTFNPINIYTSVTNTTPDQITMDINLYNFIKNNIADPLISTFDISTNIHSAYYTDISTMPLYLKTNSDISNNIFNSGYINEGDINYPCIVKNPTQSEITLYEQSIIDSAAAAAAAARVVKYIKIVQPANYLHISEVQVWSKNTTGNEINVALGRSVEQSSTGWGGSASRAVDGNTDTNYWSNTTSHTNTNNNSWWKLTLSEIAINNISRITIFNRTDCCKERIFGSVVQLINSSGTIIESYILNGGDLLSGYYFNQKFTNGIPSGSHSILPSYSNIPRCSIS